MSSGPTPPPEVGIGLHSHWKASAVALVAAVCILALVLSYCRILRPFVFSPIPRSHVQRARLNDDNFQDHSLQFHSHGLDDSIMHTLPISQFKKKEEESGAGEDGKECAICLGEFGEGDWLKHLPNCAHVFHIACIDTWFQAHSNCPLCRTGVRVVSGHSFLETLRREDFSPDRAAHYQILRSEILSAYRPEERSAGHVAPL